MPRLPIVMVAAMARNRIIGRDNALPWRMRSDLRQFKAATMGKPLVMGRKTYQSIGRPLPGRETIVLTHDQAFAAEGVHVVDSLGAAFTLADVLGKASGADEIIVAGGATIYFEALPFAERLLITEVDLEAEGDATFPEIDPAEWVQISRQAFARSEGDDADFAVAVWERR